jgi:hypothetical protein
MLLRTSCWSGFLLPLKLAKITGHYHRQVKKTIRFVMLGRSLPSSLVPRKQPPLPTIDNPTRQLCSPETELARTVSEATSPPKEDWTPPKRTGAAHVTSSPSGQPRASSRPASVSRNFESLQRDPIYRREVVLFERSWARCSDLPASTPLSVVHRHAANFLSHLPHPHLRHRLGRPTR